MKTKAVLFDIDGTILPFDGIVLNLQKTCRHFGVRVITESEVIKKTVGYTIEEGVPRIIPEVAPIIKEFAEYYREIYNKDVRSIKPFPETKGIFSWILKKDMKIGIVTTKSGFQARTTFDFYKLPYGTIVGCEDVRKVKPDSEPVVKACKRLRVKPEDCIFVGDHPFDMQASIAAGCVPVGTLTGWGNRKNLKAAGAKYLIENLSDLKDIIQ
jgi:phosphoglycolate phosphatase-like HAD superfamily hydrolase